MSIDNYSKIEYNVFEILNTGVKFMKKILSFLLVTFLCFALSACNIEDSPQKEPYDSSSVKVQTAKSEDYKLNETAVFKNIKVTATEIKESNGGDIFGPDDGNVFVGVKFVIENISDESQSISSILLFDPYADDVKCEYSITANADFGGGTLDGEIAAGKRMEGWYAVEVPSGWSKIDLDVKSSWLSGSSARFVFNKS